MTSPQTIRIRRDRAGSLAEHRTVLWATEHFGERLAAATAGAVSTGGAPASTGSGAVELVEADPGEMGAEAYLVRTRQSGVWEVVASDPRGMLYGLAEIAERAESGDDLDAAFATPVAGTPAMPVRGMVRAFSNPDEDLPWFLDEDFWREYLTFLAVNRINRFQLALGMAYNYGWDKEGATENYFCFAYPFFLDVDGWDVRAGGVDAREQARNLRMLRFISEEATRRGLHFQLGLWNHAYDYGPSATPSNPITGLTPQTHAAYSAAALAELLRACPDIAGLTLRVHYEGGIHDDGHETYWDTVFAAVSAIGRPLEVDMHAKGVDEALLTAVDKPGLSPALSMKYWAEHMGLPYHQASIRERERNRPVPPGEEMKAITEYTRRFTRYGYADYFDEDRDIDLFFRVWPGTQKLLLWADPAIIAGYGRLGTFSGSLGVDVCEPMFFKGRKGSGRPGHREVYQREQLRIDGDAWTKFRYVYLLWGRLLYDPDTRPEAWRAFLAAEYGAAAAVDAEQALAVLGRILPLVTVTHGVGGSNTAYWPEMYHDLPISPRVVDTEYNDVPLPKTWGKVSSFDPELFSGIDEYAEQLQQGSLSARYTPIEVAQWIEDLVAEGSAALARFERAAEDSPQTARTVLDLHIVAGLGRFYAGKYRAATAYARFEKTGDRALLASAVALLREAYTAYADVADRADGAYRDDLEFGVNVTERGHWKDRTPAILRDIAALEEELADTAETAIEAAGDPAPRPRAVPAELAHTAPGSYERGVPLTLTFLATDDAIRDVVLHYRHVDHRETFQSIPMTTRDGEHRATIDAAFTASSYPLMYYVTFTDKGGRPRLFPGLDASLSAQPYFTLGSAAAGA